MPTIARFSTIIRCPSVGAVPSEISRDTRSFGPPACTVRKRIGFSGYPCAAAVAQTTHALIAARPILVMRFFLLPGELSATHPPVGSLAVGTRTSSLWNAAPSRQQFVTHCYPLLQDSRVVCGSYAS